MPVMLLAVAVIVLSMSLHEVPDDFIPAADDEIVASALQNQMRNASWTRGMTLSSSIHVGPMNCKPWRFLRSGIGHRTTMSSTRDEWR